MHYQMLGGWYNLGFLIDEIISVGGSSTGAKQEKCCSHFRCFALKLRND